MSTEYWDFKHENSTILSGLPEWAPGGERNPIRYAKKRGLGNLFGPIVYVKWFLLWRDGQLEPVRLPVEFTKKKDIEHDACIERLNGRLVRLELKEYMPKNNGYILKK